MIPRAREGEESSILIRNPALPCNHPFRQGLLVPPHSTIEVWLRGKNKMNGLRKIQRSKKYFTKL